MTDLFLGISPDLLYYQGKPPRYVSEVHSPHFLAFPPSNTKAEHAHITLIKQWENNKTGGTPLSKIQHIGEIETYRSFSNYQEKRKVFKVYTKESYFVPEVSDYLFFEHGLFTAEHDIPYQQRALTDLAATGKNWLLDTHGEQKQLKIIVYDIELTKYEEGKKDLPVDIIGYSTFDIRFESEKNLEKEEFSFELLDNPSSWEDIPVHQLVSRTVDEEIDNLYSFCKLLDQYDVISGHNIAGFDNFQVYGRIQWILKNYIASLSSEKRDGFQRFLTERCRLDKSFHFGVGSEVVQFYPCSFDTYLAARKFYSFLDDFGLKALAPFLGVHIPDRVYLTPSQIKLDARTLKYNKQDVQEQIGVTLNLIQQALPLSFTTCMPFELLLPAGAVNIWDHMALIRSAAHKKIMPPICRVKSIAQTLQHDFAGCKTKEDIVRMARGKKEQLSKDFLRVVKYGEEMPEWVEYPEVIHDDHAEDEDESLGYHMPGGMTIKPDSEAHSDFVPWFHVVVADVGAMYPTILKAMNIGADTVRLATSKDNPDAWIWLKRLPKDFFKDRNICWREITAEDSYADKGYMLGVKIDSQPGVINCAMTGIMNVIAKIKKELKEAQKKGDAAEIQRLKMMYQSMKGARNAGSVDYAQRIILQNQDGNLENISIGAFVDQAIEKYGCHRKIINGTEFEFADIKDDWMAFSVNKKGTVELRRVKQAVRHKWNDKLMKITTKSGYTIVTPNHSVFTIKNGQIASIAAGEITDDTVLVHAEKIPRIERHQIINLIHTIQDQGYYGFIDKKNIQMFNGQRDILLSLNAATNHSSPYIKIALEQLKKLHISPECFKTITIGSNGRKASRIPALIPIDEGFAELFGYYVSEGHTSIKITRGNPHYYITFSSASPEMHKRIQHLSKAIFGVDAYTLDRMETAKTFVSTIHAKVIAYLFENILGCGRNSRTKTISSEILSAPQSVKHAFFTAYMEGDGNYKSEMPSSVPLGRFTTNSRRLNEDLIVLQKQLGIKTNTYFRLDEKTYNTRMIEYFKGKKESCGDCYGIPPKNIEFVDPTSNYVYDISVEDNENFLDANGGILLHNTHGILAAPTVTGRQFNLWGAAAITTKGQMILADTLKYLESKNIRVVYGDTDGIYLGCSRSSGNLPEFSNALGFSLPLDDAAWLTKPDVAFAAIKDCNKKWQTDLRYPDFELEPETHDAMIFVKHKNYLIFDMKQGKVELTTKGNNFKGSDKADIARNVLETIMIQVLQENPCWDDEKTVREAVKTSIKAKTRESLAHLDLSTVDLDDLTLIQSVQPAKRYKVNQDGSTSTFGKRAEALEKLIQQPINTRVKMKFVVTKRPLPGIQKPSKSGVKPIDYMYPVDLVKDRREIDLEWYKKMIENYIQGAFGLSDIAVTKQIGLDEWM
ncbi:MAG: hypothetical protein V1726_08000 [Methanobacteriota archaeon]